jgi:hypothetical protein
MDDETRMREDRVRKLRQAVEDAVTEWLEEGLPGDELFDTVKDAAANWLADNPAAMA